MKMRFLPLPLLLLSTSANAEEPRWQIVKLWENGAALFDTLSVTSTFAKKYKTVWMILMAKDAKDTGIEYFQSRVKIDCAERSSRTEALSVYRADGEAKDVRPDLIDKPIAPESSTEAVFNVVCLRKSDPELSSYRLLMKSEIATLSGFLDAN